MVRKVLWIIKISLIGLVEFALNAFPEGSYGDVARGKLLRIQLKKCGKNLKVSKNVRILNCKNIEIGSDVYIGYGTWMDGKYGITIGNKTMFGPYVVVASGNHEFDTNEMSFFNKSDGQAIRIGDGCWIGAKSIITSSGSVGNFSLVAAGSIITRKMPNNKKVIGVNKVIGDIF